MGKFSKYRNALAFAFAPPAVRELGQAGGFDFQLQDRGGLGHEKLMAARNQLLGLAGKEPTLTRVRPNGLEDVPQYRIDVDLDKGGALGVPVDAINNTISASFGGAYVNDFIQGGRVKRVYVQADAPYRSTSVTAPGRWRRSPPSPPDIGSRDRRGWSASTASRR
jgi:HAE1 family hydrophobic/amphiphilic exporter-1